MLDTKTRAKIIDAYHNRGLKITHIARDFDIPRTTVTYVLDNCGIPRDSRRVSVKDNEVAYIKEHRRGPKTPLTIAEELGITERRVRYIADLIKRGKL